MDLHGRQFADRVNLDYFGGALSAGVVDRISTLPLHREDARSFIERMFRSMRASGFTAVDLSVFQADILAGLLSRLLPGNWEGRVPPITVAGRHTKLDLLVRNVATQDGLPRTFIDVACGFPPVTSADTATTLADWQVTGVDRSLPACMVIDPDNNYAVFDDLGRALYFQPLVPSPETWAALLGDWEGSRRRFELLLQDLLAVHRATGSPRVERDGASLDVEPLRAWEHERLRFVRSDVSDLALPPAGVVRCCNMLLYFDRAFRSESLARLATMLEPGGLLLCGTDWIHTTEARYFTYRNRHGALADGEFNFSLDNVAPLSIASWYTLHDDDVELALLTDLVGVLRADRRFISPFMERSDALRAVMNLVPRGTDGYYVSDLPHTPPAELWTQASKLADALGEEFAPAAVEVLERQGLRARVNSVGHVAVAVPVV